MADDLLTPEQTVEFYRWCVVLYALYEDRQDIVTGSLPGYAIDVWKHLPEYEIPSYAVLSKSGHTVVVVAGTTNGVQLARHATGAFVGWNYKNGGVNSLWWNTSDRMRTALNVWMPNPSNSFRRVTFVGHSYGGALAQVLADRLIDDGKDPSTVDVWAIASPKAYTSWVGQTSHQANILLGDEDPVTILPPAAARAAYTDPITGLVPLVNPFDSWDHRGDAVWIRSDGTTSGDWTRGISDPAAWSNISFISHSPSDYAGRLLRNRSSRGLAETEELARLRTYLSQIGGNDGDVIPKSLTWHPGYPHDPLWGLLPYPVFSVSKVSSDMANAVKVQVQFKSKAFGWSETHYYYDTSPTPVPLETVEARLHTMLVARLKALQPYVIYGIHMEVESYRITRDDGSRESIPRYNPEINGLSSSTVNPDAEAGVDFPWSGMLCRLGAGAGISRTLVFRPTWNTGYMDKDGKTITHQLMKERIATVGTSYLAQNCWHIKAQNKAANPDKIVTSIAPAPSPMGGTLLAVGAHGYSPGEKIRVHGGEPNHKPYRGEFLVGPGTSADSIHLVQPLTDSVVAGGCKVYRIQYGYFKITSFVPVRMRSRDTGNGTGQGRGRR